MWLRKAVVLLLCGFCSVLIAVVSLEMILRAAQGWYFAAPDYLRYDEELAFVPIPGLEQTVGIGEHRNRLVHNSLGLRGPEIRKDRPELRALILGDSYTYGWGTNNDGTIASQLQELLSARGLDAEVINLGVGGYSTAQSYLRYKRFAYLEPDIVVYMFCNNDPEDNLVFVSGGKRPKHINSHRSTWRVLLRRQSILLRSFLSRRLFLTGWPSAELPSAEFPHEPCNPSDDVKAHLTLEFTTKIAELAESTGSMFVIGFINFDVDEGYQPRLSQVGASYEELFESNGMQVVTAVDFLSSRVQNWEEFRGNVPFMGHFSAYGYRPYAEALDAYIAEELSRDYHEPTSMP